MVCMSAELSWAAFRLIVISRSWEWSIRTRGKSANLCEFHTRDSTRSLRRHFNRSFSLSLTSLSFKLFIICTSFSVMLIWPLNLRFLGMWVKPKNYRSQKLRCIARQWSSVFGLWPQFLPLSTWLWALATLADGTKGVHCQARPERRRRRVRSGNLHFPGIVSLGNRFKMQTLWHFGKKEKLFLIVPWRRGVKMSISEARANFGPEHDMSLEVGFLVEKVDISVT